MHPMTIPSRILNWWRMRRRARRLGLPFRRRATFRLPQRVRLHDGWHLIDLPDEHGVRHDLISLWLCDEYRLDELRAPPATILDIGGNVGLFALLAKHHFPAATIHVYEPNPALTRFLSTNLDLPGVAVFPEAVGPHPGSVRLESAGDSNQTRAHASTDGTIPMTSLADAVQRLGGSVDLAKIDCEGGEWELFAAPDAWTAIARVAMEYHLDDTRRAGDAVDALTQLGFRVTAHVPSGPSFGLLFAERRTADRA